MENLNNSCILINTSEKIKLNNFLEEKDKSFIDNEFNNLNKNSRIHLENFFLDDQLKDISKQADTIFSLDNLLKINNFLSNFFLNFDIFNTLNNEKPIDKSKLIKNITKIEIQSNAFFTENVILDNNNLTEISNFFHLCNNENNFKNDFLKETIDNVLKNPIDYIINLNSAIKSNLNFFKKYNFIFDLVINYIFLKLNFLFNFLGRHYLKEDGKKIFLKKMNNIGQKISIFILQIINIYIKEIDSKNKCTKISFLCILYFNTEIHCQNLKQDDFAIDNNIFIGNFRNFNLFSIFSELITKFYSEENYFSKIKSNLFNIIYCINNHILDINNQGYYSNEFFYDMFIIFNFLFMINNDIFFERLFKEELILKQFKNNNDFTVFFILIENILNFKEIFTENISKTIIISSVDKRQNEIDRSDNNLPLKEISKVNTSKLILNILNFLKKENLQILFNKEFYKNFNLANRIIVEEKFIKIFITLNQIIIDIINSDFLYISNNNLNQFRNDDGKIILKNFMKNLKFNNNSKLFLNSFLNQFKEKSLFSEIFKKRNLYFDDDKRFYSYYDHLRKLFEKKYNFDASEKNSSDSSNIKNIIQIFSFMYYLLISNLIKTGLYQLIIYFKNNNFKSFYCPYEKENEIIIGSYQENINFYIQNHINEVLLFTKKFKFLISKENPFLSELLLITDLKEFLNFIFIYFLNSFSPNNSLDIPKSNDLKNNITTPIKSTKKRKNCNNDNNFIDIGKIKTFKKINLNEAKIVNFNLIGKIYNFYCLINKEEEKTFYSDYILNLYVSEKLIINETFYIKVNFLKVLIDNFINNSNNFIKNINNDMKKNINNINIYKIEEKFSMMFQEFICANLNKISVGFEEIEIIISNVKFLNTNIDVEKFLDLSANFLNYAIKFIIEFINILKVLKNFSNFKNLVYFLNKNEKGTNNQNSDKINLIYNQLLIDIRWNLNLIKRISKTCLIMINFNFNKNKKNKLIKDKVNGEELNKNRISSSEIKKLYSLKIKRVHSVYCFLKVFCFNKINLTDNYNKNYSEIYSFFEINEENKKEYINLFCKFYEENLLEEENTLKKRMEIIINFFFYIEEYKFFYFDIDVKKIIVTSNLNPFQEKKFENLNLRNLKLIFLILSKLDKKIYLMMINFFLENLLELIKKEKYCFYFLSELKMNFINDIIIHVSDTFQNLQDSKNEEMFHKEFVEFFKNLDFYFFYTFEGFNKIVFEDKNFERLHFLNKIYSNLCLKNMINHIEIENKYIDKDYNLDRNKEKLDIQNLNFFINFYFVQVINIINIYLSFLNKNINFVLFDTNNNFGKIYISIILQIISFIINNIYNINLRNSILTDIWKHKILLSLNFLEKENKKEYQSIKTLIFYFIYPFIKCNMNYSNIVGSININKREILTFLNSFNIKENNFYDDFNLIFDIFMNNLTSSNKDDCLEIIRLLPFNNSNNQFNKNEVYRNSDIDKSTFFLENSTQFFSNYFYYYKKFLKFSAFFNNLIKDISYQMKENNLINSNNENSIFLNNLQYSSNMINEKDILRTKQNDLMDIIKDNEFIIIKQEEGKLFFGEEFKKDKNNILKEIKIEENDFYSKSYKIKHQKDNDINLYSNKTEENITNIDYLKDDYSFIDDNNLFSNLSPYNQYFEKLLLCEIKEKNNLFIINSGTPNKNSKNDFIYNYFALKKFFTNNFIYLSDNSNNFEFFNYENKSTLKDFLRKEKLDSKIKEIDDMFEYFTSFEYSDFNNFFNININASNEIYNIEKINQKFKLFRITIILIKYNYLFSINGIDLNSILFIWDLKNNDKYSISKMILFSEINEIFQVFKNYFFNREELRENLIVENKNINSMYAKILKLLNREVKL